jgi:hypothetical protein
VADLGCTLHHRCNNGRKYHYTFILGTSAIGSNRGENDMNDEDLGFAFKQLRSDEVVIAHHGKKATVLRNDKSKWFLQDMDGMDFASQQQEMARITGNYRRGNERTAKKHLRNRYSFSTQRRGK